MRLPRSAALVVAIVFVTSVGCTGQDEDAGPTIPPDIETPPLATDEEGLIYRRYQRFETATTSTTAVEHLAVGPIDVYASGDGAIVRAIPKNGGMPRVIADLSDAGVIVDLVYAQGTLFALALKSAALPGGRARATVITIDTKSDRVAARVTLPDSLSRIGTAFGPTFLGRKAAWSAPRGREACMVAAGLVACVDAEGHVASTSMPSPMGTYGMAVRGETVFVIGADANGVRSRVLAFEGDLTKPPNEVAAVDGIAIAMAADSDALYLLTGTPARPGDSLQFGEGAQGNEIVRIDAAGTVTSGDIAARYDDIVTAVGSTLLLAQRNFNGGPSSIRLQLPYVGGCVDFARSDAMGAGERFAVPEPWFSTALATDGTWAFVGVWKGECLHLRDCNRYNCECTGHFTYEHIRRLRL